MKKYILLLTGLLAFSSCSDFLSENPPSEISVDNYFTDPRDAYSVVNDLYDVGIRDLCSSGDSYSGPAIMSFGYMSGFFDNPSYSGQRVYIKESLTLTLDPTTSFAILEQVWDPCYEAIYRANLAIERIPSTPNIKDDDKNQLLAEAHFFRAFNYFYLVKTFGDVPLILDTKLELKPLRTPSIDVYNQIVEDLIDARDNGGLPDKPMCKNGFRISKGSVNTLLADVYLTMSGYPTRGNKYAEAAAAAKEVINSGVYSLISNGATPEESAYNKMRKSDIENEYIYQTEYLAGIKENSMTTYTFPYAFVNDIDGAKYKNVCDVYKPDAKLLDIYEAADIRGQENQFFHSSFPYKAKIDDVITPKDGVFINGKQPYFWYDENAFYTTGRGDKDIKLYRYAEVLLIAAEAIAESGGSIAEAAGYLAQVRARGLKVEAGTLTAGLGAMSKDNFIQEVWKERLREFPLEFKVWSDVQRTRKIANISNATSGNFSFIDVIGSTSVKGAIFKERDLLYPIPITEIQRNPNLEQNPGYTN